MSKNSKQEQQTLESVGFWWPIHKSSLFFSVLLMCVFLTICAIICSQISEALWFLLKGCSTFVTANIQCLRLRCRYWRTSMLRPKRRPVCSWWPLAPARIKRWHGDNATIRFTISTQPLLVLNPTSDMVNHDHPRNYWGKYGKWSMAAC